MMPARATATTLRTDVPAVEPAEMSLLLGMTGIGTWSFDACSGIFVLDQTCRELFGLGADECLSPEVMHALIHPEDFARYWQAVEHALGHGEFHVDYRVILKDGAIRHLSGRGRVVAPESGDLRIRGVCIDVTERRHLEQQLETRELQLQHLADGVPGLFSYVDADYRVQFMSSLYRRLLGCELERVEGQLLVDIIGEEAFAERRPRLDEALAGRVIRHEAQRRMPSGELRYFTAAHHPHRDGSGRVVGVLSLAVDITERRDAEARLEEKSRELERSNRELEQFAYVASHDLKAPLRAIDVLVQWLREDLAGHQAGDVQENLGLLAQRATRLNRLLDDLLEYSRAGRRVGSVSMVDTRLLVEDVVGLLAPPPGFTVEIDPGLPTLAAHHGPLEQVLRNLINNAIKHHPAQAGRIRVFAEPCEEGVTFAVEDDGEGIAPEYADKVFQMFQTLKPRDDREGSGMGLAIVKRIVDWRRGRVWFHPGPEGRGTVFKFTWRPADEQELAAEQQAGAGAS